MIGFWRESALAVAATCLLIAMIAAAEAAGAFAVGACGAYGYGYDFHKLADARAAALKKCTGANCKIVGELRRGCAAMAIDAKNPCGSYGWAIGSHLGKAENASMRRCAEFGGRDCVLRAWACDEKG
jgi:Domain of unknown function (DUF4189)